MSTTRAPAPAAAALLALASVAVGCVTRGELDDLRKVQEQLLEGQKSIRSDIAGVRRALEARPPAQLPPPAPRGPDPSKVYSVPVGDAPTRGLADAWVTVVAISDFECPFCEQVGGTLRALEEAYGKDLRLVFKNNPLSSFHHRALPAAIAANCAHQQKKFWPMHDRLFANQKALGDQEIVDYARAVGLKMDEFAKCQASPDTRRRIDDDVAQATRLGARGTPAFFINGRYLSGAQRLAVFKALVDEELKKAQQSGLPRRDYYAKAVVEKGDKAM